MRSRPTRMRRGDWRTSSVPAGSPPMRWSRTPSGSARSPTVSCMPTTRPADLVRVVARYASRELSPAETGAAIAAVGERVLREAVDQAAPPLPLAVIGHGQARRAGAELRQRPRRGLRLRGGGRGAAARRDRGRRADHARRSATRAGRSTPTFVRRAATGRSRARWPDSSSTGSATRSRGSSRRCCAPAPSPATPRSAGASRTRPPTSPIRPTASPSIGCSEIRRMRERIERERVRPAEATKFHFKLGYGSLADVQFAVEMLLLRHGGPDSGGPHDEHAARRSSCSAGDRLRGAVGRARPRRGVRLPQRREVRDGGRPSGARRGDPAGRRRADRARAAARLRGVPAAGLHGRLPADHPAHAVARWSACSPKRSPTSGRPYRGRHDGRDRSPWSPAHPAASAMSSRGCSPSAATTWCSWRAPARRWRSSRSGRRPATASRSRSCRRTCRTRAPAARSPRNSPSATLHPDVLINNAGFTPAGAVRRVRRAGDARTCCA